MSLRVIVPTRLIVDEPHPCRGTAWGGGACTPRGSRQGDCPPHILPGIRVARGVRMSVNAPGCDSRSLGSGGACRRGPGLLRPGLAVPAQRSRHRRGGPCVLPSGVCRPGPCALCPIGSPAGHPERASVRGPAGQLGSVRGFRDAPGAPGEAGHRQAALRWPSRAAQRGRRAGVSLRWPVGAGRSRILREALRRRYAGGGGGTRGPCSGRGVARAHRAAPRQKERMGSLQVLPDGRAEGGGLGSTPKLVDRQ